MCEYTRNGGRSREYPPFSVKMEILAKYSQHKRSAIIRIIPYFCSMKMKDTIRNAVRFLTKAADDKQHHLFAGFAICALASIVTGYLGGIIAATIAGAAKEIYDKATKKGTPELLDFVYTAIGALAFAGASYAINWGCCFFAVPHRDWICTV